MRYTLILVLLLAGCGKSHSIERTLKGTDVELQYRIDQISSQREIIAIIPIPPFDEHGDPSYWKIITR